MKRETRTRCLVPAFDGAIFSLAWREALCQVLHGSATTTEAIRRAIQNSEESLRTLSKRYGINQKTVAKWKKRTSLVDLPTGPKDPHSTTFSLEEEAVIVAFRRHTLLPHAGASEYQPATEQLLLRKLKPKGSVITRPRSSLATRPSRSDRGLISLPCSSLKPLLHLH